MDLHSKVSTVWKRINQVHINVSATWKRARAGYVRVSGVWKQFFIDTALIPQGALILLQTSSVPTGFTRHSASDGKNIVGAGTTYSYGSNGTGTQSALISGTVANAGSHTAGGANGDGFGAPGYSAGGDHAHTYSKTITGIDDAYKEFVIASADSPSKLPVDGIVMSISTLSGFTQVQNITRLARGNSTYGTTGGSRTSSDSVASSTNGAHLHGSNRTNGGSFFAGKVGIGTAQGDHFHTVNFGVTCNIKRRILAAFASASEQLIPIGGILLWDSATPPHGYAICDGSGGTVDMRDYFCELGATGGSAAGDNTATVTIDAAAKDATHAHASATTDYNTLSTYQHTSYAWNHGHTEDSQTPSILPPYYGFYFIQRMF